MIIKVLDCQVIWSLDLNKKKKKWSSQTKKEIGDNYFTTWKESRITKVTYSSSSGYTIDMLCRTELELHFNEKLACTW